MDIESVVVVVEGKQWEKDLPELGDLEVYVAPYENAAFERELAKRIGALPPAQRADGRVEPSAFYRCVGFALARTVLFDWKNFRAGGADKPFDKAYVEALLIDPKYKTFRDGVVMAARRVQQGIKSETEALEGNSVAS
jgi:hypothetical protein